MRNGSLRSRVAGLLALLSLALVGAAGAAPDAGAKRKPKPSCYALIEQGKHGLRFSTLASGREGLASAATHHARKSRYAGQSEACASKVLAGRSYRAKLRYRSTGQIGLEVLTHTKRGWQLAYQLRKLGRAGHTTSVTATLKPIPAGVDKVALALVLRGSVSVRVGGFALELIALPVTIGPKGSTPGPIGPTSFAIGPGSWSVMTPPFEDHAVHAILLQNGKVLVMAGSGNSRNEALEGHFKSYVYDPVANTWKYIATPKDVFCSGHVQLANGNVLIVGGTKAYPEPTKPGELPKTEYKGENGSWIFNIRTESYEDVPWDKAHPREFEPGPLLNGAWYPSATELGNGDVIAFGGLSEQGTGATNTNYFIGPYNKSDVPGDEPGQWVGFGSKNLQQTFDWFWGLYPTMILTADGRLFYTGSHVFGQGLDNVELDHEHKPGVFGPAPNAPTGSSIYDFYCTPEKSPEEEHKEQNETNPNAIVKGPNGEFQRITSTPGLRDPNNRDQSTSLLLPPAQEQKVMIMGGGETYSAETPAINLTDEINLKEANPHWVPGPNLPQGEMEGGGMEPMGAGKMYVSAVALPDGNVLETGGSLLPRAANVHEASIFNPAANTFTPVAADPVGRNYHSEALLLPDGRVLTLGSNPANKATGQEGWETRISIYTPSYLQHGTRPSVSLIDNVPNTLEDEGRVTKTTQWEYGTSHQLTYTAPSAIRSAVLIRPAAVTHSSDPNQREVALEVTGGESGRLNVRLPSNPNLTPPGYYMLYLVDTEGVPSAAQWVHVGLQGASGP